MKKKVKPGNKITVHFLYLRIIERKFTKPNGFCVHPWNLEIFFVLTDSTFFVLADSTPACCAFAELWRSKAGRQGFSLIVQKST
jgi:hypothetical protein